MELVLIYTKNEGRSAQGPLCDFKPWGKNEYPHVYSAVLFKLSDSKETT